MRVPNSVYGGILSVGVASLALLTFGATTAGAAEAPAAPGDAELVIGQSLFFEWAPAVSGHFVSKDGLGC